ncbi:disulfide bond formation protein B [Candidatus Parcubacteria bacterium]|nr:disulfide bond formation protein B [Candidatus Parcubacteria bacterium]
MTHFIEVLIPYGVLLSHFLLGYILLAYIFRASWGRGTVDFIGKRAIILSFLVTLLTIFGSLFYSGVLGFAPCELCWWQRVFLYPQVVLFLTALKNKDKKVFSYSVRLTILALVVALYQVYTLYGGTSFLACTSLGGACTKLYVNAFGYISIPVMSLTTSVYLLILAFFSKKYDQNNRNA